MYTIAAVRDTKGFIRYTRPINDIRLANVKRQTVRAKFPTTIVASMTRYLSCRGLCMGSGLGKLGSDLIESKWHPWMPYCASTPPTKCGRRATAKLRLLGVAARVLFCVRIHLGPCFLHYPPRPFDRVFNSQICHLAKFV